MNANYQCAITVPLRADLAYARIANVPAWWNRGSTGQAGVLGGRFRVDWGTTWVEFVVEAADAGRSLAWRVADCCLPWLANQAEWTGTLVEWTLEPMGDATHLTMTHRGLTPDVECYAACEKGWDYHVRESLLALCATGRGAPDHGKAA